jgi:predicted RNA-binding protein
MRPSRQLYKLCEVEMCLAKAYVHVVGATADPDAPATLVMENVTRLTMEGDRIGLTSLLGASHEVTGRIVSMDFMEGRLVLESTET